MSEDTATPAPETDPQRAGAAPAKHLRPSLFAALAAPVQKFWPRETDLGRIGMVIAAPVLCWVFYTTSSGMVDIMQKEPGDWVGLGGAVIATTAILVMLTSTSWSLGADLASLIAMRRMARERVIIKTFITALVFAFVFSISAFFSFTYYYNNIFKLSSKKIVGELQPMELAADIVLPTAKEVAARYDDNTAQLDSQKPGGAAACRRGSGAAGRRRSCRSASGGPATRRREGADTAIGAQRRRSRCDHQGQAGRNRRPGELC
jgi:hypothetical protein